MPTHQVCSALESKVLLEQSGMDVESEEGRMMSLSPSADMYISD